MHHVGLAGLVLPLPNRVNAHCRVDNLERKSSYPMNAMDMIVIALALIVLYAIYGAL